MLALLEDCKLSLNLSLVQGINTNFANLKIYQSASVMSLPLFTEDL